MKKIRQYKSNELGKFCDACIASGSTGMDIVRCLWQEIQELKQDLASYQEVFVKEQKNDNEDRTTLNAIIELAHCEDA